MRCSRWSLQERREGKRKRRKEEGWKEGKTGNSWQSSGQDSGLSWLKARIQSLAHELRCRKGQETGPAGVALTFRSMSSDFFRSKLRAARRREGGGCGPLGAVSPSLGPSEGYWPLGYCPLRGAGRSPGAQGRRLWMPGAGGCLGRVRPWLPRGLGGLPGPLTSCLPDSLG